MVGLDPDNNMCNKRIKALYKKAKDVDNNFSDNHLKNIIENITKLNNRMDKINKIYYYLFLINF